MKGRAWVALSVMSYGLLSAGILFAQQASTGASSDAPSFLETLLLPGAFLVLMYIVLIRPQVKKAKEQREFLQALKPGDNVMSTGGLIGRVKTIYEREIGVDVGCGTVRILKENLFAYSVASAIKPVPTPQSKKRREKTSEA